MSHSTLRERRHGYLYFGEDPSERWSIADPVDPELEDALWRIRHSPQAVTPEDLELIAAAAEAYRHLCCYPLSGVSVRQLRDVRRAVRRG